MNLLVTGGAGFIGSNLCHYLAPRHQLVVLDALTYAGRRANLDGLDLTFVHADMTVPGVVERALREHGVEAVLHLAAESHVDRSIAGPEAFVRTNVEGTFRCLDAFRTWWDESGRPPHFRFVQVSTDEVFGSLGEGDPPFHEGTRHAPRSPYSASKAAGDHLAMAYHHTFGLPVLVTWCSNNYGPYQYPEKLIPLVLGNILAGQPLPVYGDGQNVRDWLYVEDHCRALERVLEAGRPGEGYCIGGGNQTRNLDLVERLCDLVDARRGTSSRSLITFVTDRLGHDLRYEIDCAKISEELGWKPQVSFEDGLERTVDWYLRP